MDISELYQIYQAHPVITTDSRDCPEGSIFLALKGASFDGNKFADMELIGIPHRIVVSDRGLADGNLEYKSRTEAEAQPLPVADVLSILQARIRR
mgnify:CR=1 FL=1